MTLALTLLAACRHPDPPGRAQPDPDTPGDSALDTSPPDTAPPDTGEPDSGPTTCAADDPYLLLDGADDALDDREAIQGRLDADGVVHLGPGEWRVSLDSSTLDGRWAVPLRLRDGDRLLGCTGAVLRPMPDASHWLVLVRQVEDVEIRGLSFLADPPDVGQQAILVDGATGVTIADNQFEGFADDVQIGGWPTMPDGSDIPPQDCDYGGVGPIPDADEGTDVDFVTVAASDVTVTGNTFTGSYNEAVTNTADIFLAGGVASARIADNTVAGGEWFGIAMMPNASGTCREDITGVEITGNVVSGPRAYGILGYQSYEDPTAIHDVSITANQVDTVYGDVLEGSAGAGIYLPGPVGVTVTDNALANTSLLTTNSSLNAGAIGARITDSVIARNDIRAFGYYGIDLSGSAPAADATRVTVEDNVVDGTTCPRTDGADCHDGIFIRSPSVDVLDNTVTMNRQGAITVMDTPGLVTVTGNAITTTASRAIRVILASNVELTDNIVQARAAADGEAGESAPCESVAVVQASGVRIDGGTVDQDGVDYTVYGGYGPTLYANDASVSVAGVVSTTASPWTVALVASCDDVGCGTPDADGICAYGCVADGASCVRDCVPIEIDTVTAPACDDVYVATGLTPPPVIAACASR